MGNIGQISKDERLTGAAGAISLVKGLCKCKIDINKFDDRLLLQKSMFLLNRMNVAPFYNFSMYVRGPYSSGFAKDYYAIRDSEGNEYQNAQPLEIDDRKASELSGIISRGRKFMEALTTLISVLDYNPGTKHDRVIEITREIKPGLKSEIAEAYTFLKDESKVLKIRAT
ncbi:MAG: hypothetical protein FWF40_03130 [Methanomassiliicoccaceae archaeon]|nr:hypothetical protein [Methanomassiliicoccaceae archaeon]